MHPSLSLTYIHTHTHTHTHTQDDGWEFAHSLLGVDTHFRMNEDGSLRIKLDGVLEETRANDLVCVCVCVCVYVCV